MDNRDYRIVRDGNDKYWIEERVSIFGLTLYWKNFMYSKENQSKERACEVLQWYRNQNLRLEREKQRIDVGPCDC